MSGDNYYFGDNVTMHGGRNNTGMIKNSGTSDTQEVPPALTEALAELHHLLQDLRAQVPPASVQAIDDSLPSITTDAPVPQQERHRALMAVAGIAATVGTVGRPVLEAVNKILDLVGGR
jgi:hypothetical protein